MSFLDLHPETPSTYILTNYNTLSPNSGSSSSSSRAPAASSSAALVGAEQDEGVLHSVLQDIKEWRVSSTVVDDPSEGERIDPRSPYRTVYSTA